MSPTLFIGKQNTAPSLGEELFERNTGESVVLQIESVRNERNQ
jgi:hypothetical protein